VSSRPGRRRLLAAAAVAACAVGAAVLLWHQDPAAPGNPYPRCLLHALTGLHCPGCGALRALHRLLHGQLAAAFRMNALVVVLLPLVLLGLVQQALPRLWPAWAPERASPRSVWALFAVLALFAVARNLPVEPFRRLAPEESPSTASARRSPPRGQAPPLTRSARTTAL
jgi:hypothetical protein